MKKKQQVNSDRLSYLIEEIRNGKVLPDSKLWAASDLITENHIEEAKTLLKTSNHPKAREWLEALGESQKGSGQRSRSRGCVVAMAVFFLIFVVIGFLLPDDGANRTGNNVTPEVITADKGVITVPGSAFIDGRDLSAVPPATIMRVNIWNSSSRERVVCSLDHGEAVEILEAKWIEAEDRYYFRLESDSCSGWVSEPFVSPEKQAPVGDQL